jgi:hypothetical protein
MGLSRMVMGEGAPKVRTEGGPSSPPYGAPTPVWALHRGVLGTK